jgi:hypothetical protein
MLKPLLCIIFILSSLTGVAQSYNQRKFHFRASFPYINHIQQFANDTVRSNLGFIGVSLGVDYGDSLKTTELRIASTTDFFVPFGPVRIEGQFTRSYGLHASISRSRFLHFNSDPGPIKKIEFGYGIHFARYRWQRINTSLTPSAITEDRNNSLGFTGFINLYFGKRFYVGALYRPSILTVHPSSKFEYQHVFSIDFGWRF